MDSHWWPGYGIPCRDTVLDRIVALKVINQSIADSDGYANAHRQRSSISNSISNYRTIAYYYAGAKCGVSYQMGHVGLWRRAVQGPDWRRGGTYGSVYVTDPHNDRIQKFSGGQ